MTTSQQSIQSVESDKHEKDLVVKHLEMIQGIVNRLNFNSFLIKGWSMTILVVTLLFIIRNIDATSSILIYILIPMILGFMLLDTYYLWQERLFREVYNDIRVLPSTDFAMDVRKHYKKPKCRCANVFLSLTILGFYAIELILVLVLKSIIS